MHQPASPRWRPKPWNRMASNAISPLHYRPTNLGSGSLWRYSGSSWKLILIKLNRLLFFVFIEETPRESKKRNNRTSPEKDEGTLIALNVRANKYDQYMSHNLMSRFVFLFFFFGNSSYVQRPDDTVIKQPPKYPFPRRRQGRKWSFMLPP